MTNERKELLEPVIRSIMESKGHATDEEVAKAVEVFDTLTENKTAYSYEHPDYGPMVKEVPEALRRLLDNSDDHKDLSLKDDIMDECSKMERSVLVDAVNSIIYFWMDKWHKFDSDDEEEEYDDNEEEYDYDEEELAPRQKYCGWAYGGKVRNMPVKTLKKYTLRIELKDSNPQVWRELEVPSSISLSSLAQAILLAMGWDEDHLHQFIGKGKNYYSTSQNQPDSPFSQGDKDGSRYGISHLLQKEGDSTVFEYDYGDSWRHVVKLKKVDEYAAGEQKTVQLTGGANACPPDDCGGIYRYNHLVELMQKKPNSRELREFYDWMGCKWDATFFPLKEAAKAVDRMN